ncbi:hypothetical protein HanIR_Chr17g0878161 [Helianthus annuus]|nr:hypothetical protein HanIR_Chr17g0878161 [Helianthus annuus]
MFCTTALTFIVRCGNILSNKRSFGRIVLWHHALWIIQIQVLLIQ